MLKLYIKSDFCLVTISWEFERNGSHYNSRNMNTEREDKKRAFLTRQNSNLFPFKLGCRWSEKSWLWHKHAHAYKCTYLQLASCCTKVKSFDYDKEWGHSSWCVSDRATFSEPSLWTAGILEQIRLRADVRLRVKLSLRKEECTKANILKKKYYKCIRQNSEHDQCD